MALAPTGVRDSRPHWGVWGDRLVGLAAVGAALSLGHAWMTQYANPEGNGFLGSKLSGPVVDLMPTPADQPALQPLLGMHYFSDLQLAIAYGKTANPYTIDYPAQYPPLGILEFRALGLLGYSGSLWVFLLASVGLLCWVGWQMMGDLQRPRKLANLLILVVLTPAMIMAVDRGALSPLAIALVGCAFLAARRERWVLSGVVLVLAVSLKPYLVLLLLYPLLRGFWKYALATGVGAVVGNLAAFVVFPGNVWQSVDGLLSATLRYASSANAAEQAVTVKFVTLDAVSGTGTLLRLITWLKNIDVASMVYDDHANLVLVPGILFLAVLGVILLNRRLPFWAPLSLTLAATTVVLPATPLYTLTWASLAAFIFGADGIDPFPSRTGGQVSARSEFVLRVTFLVALAACLLPTFWLIPGLERGAQDAAGLVGPAAILVAALVTAVVAVSDAVHHRGTTTGSRSTSR